MLDAADYGFRRGVSGWREEEEKSLEAGADSGFLVGTQDSTSASPLLIDDCGEQPRNNITQGFDKSVRTKLNDELLSIF